MKVVLALLACVAVSHAAFTGTLQQRAQPALAQAMFKTRLVAGRSAVRGELLDALQQHANNVLAQIQTAVEHGQSIAAGLVQDFQDTMEQIQAAGGVGAIAQGHLSNLLSGLLGNLFGNGKSLAAISNLVQNFNIEALQDAVTAAVSAAFAQAQNLLTQLELPQLLQNAFASLFAQRGWFGDMWNAVSGAISQAGNAAWNHVTGTASDLWDQVVDTYEEITGHASNAWDSVTDIASSFVAEATAVGSTMTQEAINQMGDLLASHQDQLSADLWNQVQGVINNANANGKPQGKKLF